MDCADQNLIKGNPRHPRREVLRAEVRDGSQHRPRSFANIHDFAAVEQDKNPAAEAFGDIGKILDFQSATMTDSFGLSSPEDFDVGGVRIDPLSAYAEVKDFSMTHKGEKVPILSFADLKFDFSYYSATKRAAIIDKIELNGFFANLKRDGEKKFNIEKIFLKNKTEKSGEPLYFSINNIKITNSALELSDEITGAKVSAKNLNINIPFVSTIPYDTELFITPGFDGVIKISVSYESRGCPH